VNLSGDDLDGISVVGESLKNGGQFFPPHSDYRQAMFKVPAAYG
jgi:hypothetical protein